MGEACLAPTEGWRLHPLDRDPGAGLMRGVEGAIIAGIVVTA